MSIPTRPQGRLRIALINPNTDAQATQLMLDSARNGLADNVQVMGYTAPAGSPLITDQAALEAAAGVVVPLGIGLAAEGFDALIVSGFGDPGLLALRHAVAIPVVGIAEAGISEAASGGRRYSIVTITPALHESLRGSAQRYGCSAGLASIRYTHGDPLALVREPLALQQALLAACRVAVADDGAQAVVIGGGPLARAAVAIAQHLPVPLVEPVAAAVRRVLRLLGAR